MAKEQDSHERDITAKRMMWIDGVGGFLFLTGDEWLIGSPAAGDSVEIHVQGDLSRRAAAIRRQGGDYILQPLAETKMDDQVLERPTLLHDGAIFQLGSSVRMQFSKPHPLSASARLNVVSRHRTEPRADGVILLADTCVMGPSKGAHISCKSWSSDAILFLGGGSWQIRSDEPFQINGKTSHRMEIPAPCRIESETIGMSMELVS